MNFLLELLKTIMSTPQTSQQADDPKQQNQTSGMSSQDDALEEDGTPVLDEGELEENALADDEVEDIEWEDAGSETLGETDETENDLLAEDVDAEDEDDDDDDEEDIL